MSNGLSLLMFLGVLVGQYCWASYCAVFGISPDLVLIAVIYVSLRRGAMQGQLYGFAWGIAWDIISGDLFGSHAFLFTVFGFLIGKLSHRMDETKYFTQASLTAAATLALVGGMSVLYYVFGPQSYAAPANYIVWARVVLNAALAPAFFSAASLVPRRSAEN